MSRPRFVALAGLTVLALGLTACDSTARQAAGPPPSVTTAAPTEEPTPEATTAPPTSTPTPSVTPATPPTPAPEVASADLAAVQTRLTAQKYFRGPIDGKRSAALTSAVMAFQKVSGLTADGSPGAKTVAALAAPAAPVLKGGPANRVEVDLTKQVLYLVKGGELVTVLPVSSGSGKKYATASGGSATALTPVGTFTIQRRIVGVRTAALGVLYDPQYFYKGWAIHGSPSVPAYPASHGCVRVSRADGTWLLGQIGVGWTVSLYGGSHTFPAGSKAAGTDDPGGDDPATPPVPTTPPVAPTTPPVTTTPPATPTSPAPTTSGPTPTPT